MIVQSVVLSLIVSTAPWSESRNLAFGGASTWVLMNSNTRKTQQLELPRGAGAERLAASGNGEVIVFSGLAPGSGNGVFSWDGHVDSVPRRLSAAGATAGDVMLSADAKWAYFAASASGPPGAHAMKDWGQIFRSTIDGSTLEQLTSGPGCHMLPAPIGNMFLLVHANCRGLKWIELHLSSESVDADHAHSRETLDFTEVNTSPDGKTIIVSSTKRERIELWVSDLTAIHSFKRVTNFEATSTLARPQFGRSADEIFYQRRGQVWVRSQQVEKPIFNLTGVSVQ